MKILAASVASDLAKGYAEFTETVVHDSAALDALIRSAADAQQIEIVLPLSQIEPQALNEARACGYMVYVSKSSGYVSISWE